jgi:RNA polymerase-associated protein RTF1
VSHFVIVDDCLNYLLSFQERKKVVDSDESESDFGDDDDEDSDDDYEDTAVAAKPWQRKAAESKTSRLDQVEESDDDMADVDRGEDDANYNQGRAATEAELEDYQKITLPRRRLGRWCNEPFFKDAVMNCFVKLFIGENEQGKRCYRLCRIVGVETNAASYQLPPVKKEKPVRKFIVLLRLTGPSNVRSHLVYLFIFEFFSRLLLTSF